MGLFDRKKPAASARRRVVVLGIDGTPYTFIQRMVQEGRMPHLARVIAGGTLLRMNSVHPTVSSVAWSSFMTGKNPAKHGIFGFVDREPATMKVFIPTSQAMKSPTLWEILSAAGKRVIVINVPVTYPPRPVNGILIADFLAPKLEKAVYPPALAATLQSWGYRIDTDPWLGHESKDKLLEDVNLVFDRRVEAMFRLMEQEEWDYFHCHIMETDRLFHFLWEEMETNDPVYAPRFFAFIQKLDQLIGELTRRLDEHTDLLIMSDHGFCTLEKEVYVNHWLAEEEWLKFAVPAPKSVADISGETIAYSMDPGRIFINLRGRERDGRVPPAEYEHWRERIIQGALALRDPDTGRPLFRAALRREEIYHGPLLPQAADIILVPHEGFDPKGSVNKEQLTYKGPALVGMHTYDDAALVIAGRRIAPARTPWVADVMPAILELMGVANPGDLDGQSLLSLT